MKLLYWNCTEIYLWHTTLFSRAIHVEKIIHLKCYYCFCHVSCDIPLCYDDTSIFIECIITKKVYVNTTNFHVVFTWKKIFLSKICWRAMTNILALNDGKTFSNEHIPISCVIAYCIWINNVLSDTGPLDDDQRPFQTDAPTKLTRPAPIQ